MSISSRNTIQPVPRFGHAQLAPAGGLLAHRLAEHVGQVDHADIAAHAGDIHRGRGLVLNLDLDLDVVHRVLRDPLAEALPGRFGGTVAHQRVEQALHRRLARGFAHGFATAVFLQPDRLFHQIARDLFDVAADIADFGELGRFHLREGRFGQPREAAADLGLAATGRADHQDVLGRHLVAQVRPQPLPAPAIAQRHGNRALGILLADDVFVESGDNRLGGEGISHFYP